MDFFAAKLETAFLISRMISSPKAVLNRKTPSPVEQRLHYHQSTETHVSLSNMNREYKQKWRIPCTRTDKVKDTASKSIEEMNESSKGYEAIRVTKRESTSRNESLPSNFYGDDRQVVLHCLRSSCQSLWEEETLSFRRRVANFIVAVVVVVFLFWFQSILTNNRDMPENEAILVSHSSDSYMKLVWDYLQWTSKSFSFRSLSRQEKDGESVNHMTHCPDKA